MISATPFLGYGLLHGLAVGNGYRRIHALLRREGWRINHKAVHRIYVEEGLQVRNRKRKRISQGERQPLAVPQAPGERWSMDFQHDMLASGRRFRTLNIVDDFSRANKRKRSAVSRTRTLNLIDRFWGAGQARKTFLA
jgi:putative transposase